MSATTLRRRAVPAAVTGPRAHREQASLQFNQGSSEFSRFLSVTVIATVVLLVYVFYMRESVLLPPGQLMVSKFGCLLGGSVRRVNWRPTQRFALNIARRTHPEPVVLRHTLVERWKALGKWTPEYLAGVDSVLRNVYRKSNKAEGNHQLTPAWHAWAPRVFGPIWNPSKPMANVSSLKWHNPVELINISSSTFFTSIQGSRKSMSGHGSPLESRNAEPKLHPLPWQPGYRESFALVEDMPAAPSVDNHGQPVPWFVEVDSRHPSPLKRLNDALTTSESEAPPEEYLYYTGGVEDFSSVRVEFFVSRMRWLTICPAGIIRRFGCGGANFGSQKNADERMGWSEGRSDTSAL